jgi:hypothetical protein
VLVVTSSDRAYHHRHQWQKLSENVEVPEEFSIKPNTEIHGHYTHVIVEPVPFGHRVDKHTVVKMDVDLPNKLIATETIVAPHHGSQESTFQLTSRHVILPTDTGSVNYRINSTQ